MAQLTKAQLIEKANTFRRNADRLRRTLGPNFASEVRTGRASLVAAGLTATEVEELLPVSLERVVPPCRLRPLADHVVVLPADVADVTKGGIIVPDSAKEKPRQGEVLAVGPGRTEPGIGTIVPAISVGDQVLFGLYSGIAVQLDDVGVLIMREEDVLGVLTPKAES